MKLVEVSIDSDVRHELADHQVMLSFNNDTDGIAFHDWWIEEGRKAYTVWLGKNRAEYE